MSNIAYDRLLQEYNHMKNNPIGGFIVNPAQNRDGTIDLLNWKCYIPGKKNTPWEDGIYLLQMTFDEDYPSTPPRCKFPPNFFHPNVFSSGTVCSSILDEEKDWRPIISIRNILLCIQDLLNEPNIRDPAQGYAFHVYYNNRSEYNELIREQARAMSVVDLE